MPGPWRRRQVGSRDVVKRSAHPRPAPVAARGLRGRVGRAGDVQTGKGVRPRRGGGGGAGSGACGKRMTERSPAWAGGMWWWLWWLYVDGLKLSKNMPTPALTDGTGTGPLPPVHGGRGTSETASCGGGGGGERGGKRDPPTGLGSVRAGPCSGGAGRTRLDGDGREWESKRRAACPAGPRARAVGRGHARTGLLGGGHPVWRRGSRGQFQGQVEEQTGVKSWGRRYKKGEAAAAQRAETAWPGHRGRGAQAALEAAAVSRGEGEARQDECGCWREKRGRRWGEEVACTPPGAA